MILMLCVGLVLIGSQNISAADKTFNMPLESIQPIGNNNGCNANKVAGSYTFSQFNPTYGKTFVDQLNFGDEGTVYWQWTGSLELPITVGTGSPYVGSWKCVSGGNMMFTVIVGVYLPTTTGGDVELSYYFRFTMLYNVDGDELKRVRRVRKCFLPTEDPTDPNGVPGCGTNISTSAYNFKRLKPMDSDLN